MVRNVEFEVFCVNAAKQMKEMEFEERRGERKGCLVRRSGLETEKPSRSVSVTLSQITGMISNQ